MSLELQIRSSVLAELAVRSVQSQLLVACFPASPLGFVDHVDRTGGGRRRSFASLEGQE